MNVSFNDFLRSLGINPPEVFTPGKWQDCHTASHARKKKGRVKLSEDGKIGFAIDYITMTQCEVWREGDDQCETKAERTAEDNAALSARIALRTAEEKQGIMRAKALYATSTALLQADHDYLRKKRVDMNGARGLRVDSKSWLVVPVYRDNKLISCQRISPDGEKKFVYGAPVKWGQFNIWRPGAAMTVLCEGLATGLSVFAAVTTARVIVCFSAANMVAVAEREDWSGMVAVASDNDHWTEEDIGKNPGQEAACRAAEAIGCGYALPLCDGTDWNDYFCERLAILEKLDEKKDRRSSPYQLRQSALMPIRTEIMRVAKGIVRRYAEK